MGGEEARCLVFVVIRVRAGDKELVFEVYQSGELESRGKLVKRCVVSAEGMVEGPGGLVIPCEGLLPPDKAESIVLDDRTLRQICALVF